MRDEKSNSIQPLLHSPFCAVMLSPTSANIHVSVGGLYAGGNSSYSSLSYRLNAGGLEGLQLVHNDRSVSVDE